MHIPFGIPAGAALYFMAAAVFAQPAFPNRPVRIVTGGAGAQNDMLARVISPRLSDAWGQPIVIENRAGAGGQVAASTVAKASPDGYTVLLLSNQFSIAAALNANLPYDPVRDFAGVSQIGFATIVLVTSPSLGVKSAQELIAMARAKPGMLFSSSGGGSGTHLNCEMFRHAAGFKAVHVGFRSSAEAGLEVAAARVHWSILPLGPALPLVRDGKLLALAVANQRVAQLPDLPTIKEVVPDFQRAGSFGLVAPAATPKPVLAQFSREVRRALDAPEVRERLGNMGFSPSSSTPEEFDKLVRADIQTFIRMAKEAGLRK
jgi:tripartite-type tricarboxylate transporter receptor subunit TctC